MNEAGAENTAKEPEPLQKVVAGSGEGTEQVRQAFTAGKEEASEETTTLMEQVVGRENLRRALKRVLANKGAPGVDAMSVEELAPYLKANWTRLREELLSETYQPMPVRAVDIPKPGGGVRTLGIPTVLDRFIQNEDPDILFFQELWYESDFNTLLEVARTHWYVAAIKSFQKIKDRNPLSFPQGFGLQILVKQDILANRSDFSWITLEPYPAKQPWYEVGVKTQRGLLY